MRLRYETSIATLVQFIVMVSLNFINGGVSIVSDCVNNASAECVSNGLVSLILILLLVVWFGFLAVLGYAAQDRRSHRLAQVLIAAEGMTLVVSLFDAKHYPSILELIINLISAALAIWVIILAWRLMRAKGGRITAPARARRRRLSSKKKVSSE